MYVAFPRSEYYDASDFHIGFSGFSVLMLVPQYSVLLRPIWFSHVHPSAFITCRALRPRGWFLLVALNAVDTLAFYFLKKISLSQFTVFGAQSLQLALTAYNVSYLRLTCYITATCPRLDTKCTGPVLSRQHFQLLAEWRFRGAPRIPAEGHHGKNLTLIEEYVKFLSNTHLKQGWNTLSLPTS